MLQQFKDLECFLSQGTQKGVFTVIAKDNIDLNSRSTAATMDNYGTDFSLIQIYSEESEDTVCEYIYTMDNDINFFPEGNSQIGTFQA